MPPPMNNDILALEKKENENEEPELTEQDYEEYFDYINKGKKNSLLIWKSLNWPKKKQNYLLYIFFSN